MDFQQAQTRFNWLEAQFRSGAINEGQYQAGLNELRVTDAWGRLWMPQAHSGIWHMYSNGAWVAAQPPVPLPPAQAPAAPVYAPVPSAAYPPQTAMPKPESSVFSRYLRMLLIWLGIWVLIAVVYWFAYGSSHGEEGQQILLGIGAAAALSLVLTLWTMRGSWKGQVVEIRIIKEDQGDDDGPDWVDVRYAMIRTVDGKMRKERAMNDWKEGDWLEKKSGENWVRKL